MILKSAGIYSDEQLERIVANRAANPGMGLAEAAVKFGGRKEIEFLEAVGKQAELESSVWLLARELKKTQRHVNALEHIFIPDYKETLKYVEQALESKELDSFFTMKIVKKRMVKENDAQKDAEKKTGDAQ